MPEASVIVARVRHDIFGWLKMSQVNCHDGVLAPHTLGQRPAVTPGQIAHQSGGVLTRLQPRLYPGEARPQQFQQLSVFPPAKAGAYPGGSSRLRFCCLHTRIIARRLPRAKTCATLSGRSNP
jgi:hypothetical protein